MRRTARDLAHAHAHALALARDGILARDDDLARDLARDLAFALAHNGTLTLTLDSALALAHNLDSALSLSLAHNLNLAHNRAHARDRAHNLDCAHNLARARDRAREVVSALERARRSTMLGAARAGATGGARSMPGRVARGVVALTVRLLPVVQRPRYRQEFSVELAELPRRARWGYALRVLASAWELRQALGDAGPTQDGEPARRAER